MKKLTTLLMATPLFVMACTATPATVSQPVAVHPKADSVAVREAGVWIDVRSADEYAKGHLIDTLNLPHATIGDYIAQSVPDKNTPIHVYCHSGRRAQIAKNILENMGYTNVTNQGAYDDLVKKGVR